MSSNPFEALAESQIANPVKSRMKAVETRRANREKAEKELEEQDILTRQWRRWRKKRLQALLDGPFGKDVRGLIRFMDTMTLSSAPAFLKVVTEATWAKEMSLNERHELLSVISARITKLRLKEGLPPFDDALFDEPPKAFEIIKEYLGVH